MTEAPAVSIIVPTYNDERWIAETIKSVLSQTFSDFELLIIDDHSVDGTRAVLQSQTDDRIRLFFNGTNVGPAETRNRGLECARGQFIAFLDSDDLWDADKLQTQIEHMKKSGAAFTYTRYRLIDSDGTTFGASGKLPRSATYRGLLNHCFIRTSTVIYDCNRTGGKHSFADLRKRQDFAMFLSLLKAVPRADLVDVETCSYRIRSGSVSSRKHENIRYQWTLYRVVEGLSLFRSLTLLSGWFVRAATVNAKRWFYRHAL